MDQKWVAISPVVAQFEPNPFHPDALLPSSFRLLRLPTRDHEWWPPSVNQFQAFPE
jgi:hypothetical protein